MKGACIFIIEDSKIILETIKHILELELEARVLPFDSAEAALEKLDIYNPDIILLDYYLDSQDKNNMNGLDFIKRLSLRKKMPFIIMISGQRDKLITTKVLQTGAVNYLSKEDEGFLDNLVIEIQSNLKTKKIHQKQAKQYRELRVRRVRVAAFIVVPVLIALIINHCQ
ncbi:MAG: response regulator [Crocinitomicaceae bacterium]|nr:response regulator [Crocinitomicaceae bacterium]